MGYEFEWLKELDERQQKEIRFARLYAAEFSHGTDGHNRLLIVAKLADMLDKSELEKRNVNQPD